MLTGAPENFRKIVRIYSGKNSLKIILNCIKDDCSSGNELHKETGHRKSIILSLVEDVAETYANYPFLHKNETMFFLDG